KRPCQNLLAGPFYVVRNVGRTAGGEGRRLSAVRAAAGQKDSQSSLSLTAGLRAAGASSAAAGALALGLAAARGGAGVLPSEATVLGGAATVRAGVVMCTDGPAAGPGAPWPPAPLTRN